MLAAALLEWSITRLKLLAPAAIDNAANNFRKNKNNRIKSSQWINNLFFSLMTQNTNTRIFRRQTDYLIHNTLRFNVFAMLLFSTPNNFKFMIQLCVGSIKQCSAVHRSHQVQIFWGFAWGVCSVIVHWEVLANSKPFYALLIELPHGMRSFLGSVSYNVSRMNTFIEQPWTGFAMCLMQSWSIVMNKWLWRWPS